VRREVARATVGAIQVSASIGYASSPPCSSVEVALLRADEDLYRAKARHGRVRSRTSARLQAGL
jgi:GGDEF domain-containing protein